MPSLPFLLSPIHQTNFPNKLPLPLLAGGGNLSGNFKITHFAATSFVVISSVTKVNHIRDKVNNTFLSSPLKLEIKPGKENRIAFLIS